MEKARQITLEWIPSAYKNDEPKVGVEGSVVKTELTAPVYCGKKKLLKRGVGNIRKKP